MNVEVDANWRRKPGALAAEAGFLVTIGVSSCDPTVVSWGFGMIPAASLDSTFSRSDFRYDPTTHVYHCPAGKTLTTTGTLVNGGTTLIYLARKRDGCKLRVLS
jgi:hypothetical protein